MACGIRLEENTCLKCGTRLPVEAKFCLVCGVLLAGKTPVFLPLDDSQGDKITPVESAAPESGHRQRMVMFYDLVGLAPLSRQKAAILHATFFVAAFALLIWIYSLERVGWPDPAYISAWCPLETAVISLSSDAPENRLSNASFEKGEEGGPVPVAGWSIADFWNSNQAQGWRKRVKATTGYALELGVTGAPGYGCRLGVQQSCGELPAGTRRVALVVDVNIPRDLQKVGLQVVAVLYPLESTGQGVISVGVGRTKATRGWERLSNYEMIPSTAGRMAGMMIIHLIPQDKLVNVSEAAQFDNVKLVPLKSLPGEPVVYAR